MTKKQIAKFWSKVLSSSDPTSSKRLITLVLAGIFILAQVAVVFICFYVIFYTTKGAVDKDLLNMLGTVLDYDFYIILSGLGFITADNTIQLLMQRAQTKAALVNALANPVQVVTTPVQPPPDAPVEQPIETPPPEDGPPVEIYPEQR